MCIEAQKNKKRGDSAYFRYNSLESMSGSCVKRHLATLVLVSMLLKRDPNDIGGWQILLIEERIGGIGEQDRRRMRSMMVRVGRLLDRKNEGDHGACWE